LHAEPAGVPARSLDSGLASLALIARFHGKAAEPEQLAHELGLSASAGAEELLLAAKRLDGIGPGTSYAHASSPERCGSVRENRYPGEVPWIPSAGNTDVAKFLAGVATDQIWFRQAGNDLEASIIGTSDLLTIQSRYSGSANHVEQFKTADGSKTLLDSQVQSLINAMAAFAPPAAGQTTLPQNYADALNPVIGANWQ